MPPKDQILMGVAVAVLSLVGLWQTDWLVQNTRKGEWLARRLGERRAGLVLRAAFALLAVFGALLAANVIRPLRW